MLLPLLLSLQVDLDLDPPISCVPPGGVVELELTLEAQTPSLVSAVDTVLTWNPAELILLDGQALGPDWFTSGFFPDPDGFNATLDGTAIFTQLANFVQPPLIGPETPVALIRFLAISDGAVQVPASAGSAALTAVFGVVPGQTLTGALPAPVQVGVGPATASNEAVRSGVPPNPNALLPGVSSGPVLGSVWDPRIDHTSFVPNALLDLLAVSLAPTNLPLPGFGTLLCALPITAGPFETAPGQPFVLPIPSDCKLLGVGLCTQGISVGADLAVQLTNALDITLGSF